MLTELNLHTNDISGNIPSSINYTLTSQVATVYVIVKQGEYKSEVTEVEIRLRPEITKNGNALIATSVVGATYRWFFDNVMLEETASNTLDIGTQYGEYYVSMILDKCISTSPVYIVSADGIITSFDKITEADFSDIQLWPNPAAEIVNLSFENNYWGEIQISLHDITGRKVEMWSATKNSKSYRIEIPVNTFKSGIYIIKLTTDKQSVVKRFVIRED